MITLTRLLYRTMPNFLFSHDIAMLQRERNLKLRGKSGDEWTNIDYEYHFEISSLESQWEEYKSDKLIRRAKKYDIEIPSKPQMPESDSSYWNYDSGLLYLNQKGRTLIRQAIREENKWNRENFTFWVSIFFGIIGCLTGLGSIILN